MSDRLERYIAIATQLTAAAERLAQEATAYLRETGREQTFRDRVLVGLALKIDGAFRALIDDARTERAEAMHHLKTMAEAFIYFHAIVDYVADDGLASARKSSRREGLFPPRTGRAGG